MSVSDLPDRSWLMGQALANPKLCTGEASQWQLRAWFGEHRTGITASEIVAKQAGDYADGIINEVMK